MNRHLLSLALITLAGLWSPSFAAADECTAAADRISSLIAVPPATGVEQELQSALNRCPADPKLYDLIGDYYNHWSRNDANPAKQALYNYFATEYFAKGIKTGDGPQVDQMKFKLAALESATEDITAVGIRSIKPYARLNIKVYYDYASSQLGKGAQEQLDELGRYLSEGNSGRIILEGHTDKAGSQEYNRRLSAKRAESAKDYLVKQYNVAPESIEIQGYGFERLADVTNPYSGKNRRVRVRKLID